MSQKSVSASFFAFNALVGNCPALLTPVQGEGKRQTASEIFDVSLRQVRHFSRAGKRGCLAVRFAHSFTGLRSSTPASVRGACLARCLRRLADYQRWVLTQKKFKFFARRCSIQGFANIICHNTLVYLAHCTWRQAAITANQLVGVCE